MRVHEQPTTTVQQLRALLEVGRLVRDERDLQALFDRVAATIADALGFATVAINAHRPARDDFQVMTVHGRDAARETLLGNTTDHASWQPYLDERFRRRGAYLVRHDQIDWVDMHPVWTPDLEPSDDPDAWHPDDVLIVTLERSDGQVLGFVSVDEPLSGRVPGDEEIDLLVALAAHVSAAIESAQTSFLAERHRAALARLLEVSASLVDVESVESVLDKIARGIHDALEFERVAVCVHVDERGGFTPLSAAGFEVDAPELDFSISQEGFDRLFVPEFEVAGCYLIENEVARSLVSGASSFVSTRNGSGPGAWNRHWLLVPLIERDGSRRGFIWADDPADSLLPSRERLQALRTFANQATMALRAALDFETLNRRNDELAALHETTFALLEHRDSAGVLEAVVDNARRLAATDHAYLYLVDQGGERLRLAVGLGFFAEIEAPLLARGEGVSGRAWEEAKPVVVDDYLTWSGGIDAFRSRTMHATVGVPLLVGREVVGVLGLVSDEAGRRFAEAEISLLERFAQLAALALESARLYAALQQSEETHRRIVEEATELICLLTPDSTISLVSPSVEAALGFVPAEIVGSPFADFVHPDDLPEAAQNFRAALKGEPSTMAMRVRHADGSWIVMEGTASAITGPDGRTLHVLATARDVSERRSLEEQLRHAQKMESIGRLAGGVAHDFNNILTAIRGYAELLLLDLADDAPARESAAEIARAAGRAASLTGQLLAFSRKQVLRPQRLDLNDVVSSMASMLARMLGEDVVLATALEPALRPTLADPTQLEQVVLNLAVNARDAMPAGGRLTIRTANVDLDTGAHVALVVADTGEGMDAATAERIFEPFFTTKEVGAGTGLGLATVHGIVAQSGGSIEVTSEPGVGTTFTICLPTASA